MNYECELMQGRLPESADSLENLLAEGVSASSPLSRVWTQTLRHNCVHVNTANVATADDVHGNIQLWCLSHTPNLSPVSLQVPGSLTALSDPVSC